ncbi:hypothetical protein BB561_004941 [Smittium simulii]|uniref:Uncharacterized protein n=1 Tax=Smittium simulii TaxID=133385 RepID=A0A2T9YD88_9FUNG|nr:hypothetical protein BB561_004941 [Smittium simulii]
MSSKTVSSKPQDPDSLEVEETWEEINSQAELKLNSQHSSSQAETQLNSQHGFTQPEIKFNIQDSSTQTSSVNSTHSDQTQPEQTPAEISNSSEPINHLKPDSSNSQTKNDFQQDSQIIIPSIPLKPEIAPSSSVDSEKNLSKVPNTHLSFFPNFISLKWLNIRNFNRILLVSITTIVLPFVSGAMIGLGEIVAHQFMYNWGWRTARPLLAPNSNLFFP